MFFGRQEKTALLILLIVLAIVLCLHVLMVGLGTAPFVQPFNPDCPDGELVFFEGTIETVRHTESGNHLIVVADGVQIFVPETALPAILPMSSDKIRVTGTSSTYHGEKEIVVKRTEDILVFPSGEDI